jgi:hypothetical protein
MPIPTLSTDERGVGFLSRKGPNGTTNSSIATSTAGVIDTRTKEEIKDAIKNTNDGERKYPYAGRKERTNSSEKNPELFGLAKTAAEEKKKECSQSNSSYFSSCAVMGGKRRKTRKQRGSRKNKKSRRR